MVGEHTVDVAGANERRQLLNVAMHCIQVVATPSCSVTLLLWISHRSHLTASEM